MSAAVGNNGEGSTHIKRQLCASLSPAGRLSQHGERDPALALHTSRGIAKATPCSNDKEKHPCCKNRAPLLQQQKVRRVEMAQSERCVEQGLR